jgi:hypothetical protein
LRRIRFPNSALDEEWRGVRDSAVGGFRRSRPGTFNYDCELTPTGTLHRQTTRTMVAENHRIAAFPALRPTSVPTHHDHHHDFLVLQPKRDGFGATMAC